MTRAEFWKCSNVTPAGLLFTLCVSIPILIGIKIQGSSVGSATNVRTRKRRISVARVKEAPPIPLKDPKNRVKS